MSRRSNSPPSIFSLSFIDILACSLGAVLFILILVLLQSATLTDAADIFPIIWKTRDQNREEKKRIEKLKKKLKSAKKMKKKKISSSDDFRTINRLKNDIQVLNSRILPQKEKFRNRQEEIRTLERNRDESSAALTRLKKDIHKTEIHILDLEHRINKEKERYRKEQEFFKKVKSHEIVPVSPFPIGESSSVWRRFHHLDCQKDRLIIFNGEFPKGYPIKTENIRSSGTPYIELLRRLKAKSKKDEIIIFWIRPDGISTFLECNIGALNAKHICFSWEPAESNWVFMFDFKGK